MWALRLKSIKLSQLSNCQTSDAHLYKIVAARFGLLAPLEDQFLAFVHTHLVFARIGVFWTHFQWLGITLFVRGSTLARVAGTS